MSKYRTASFSAVLRGKTTGLKSLVGPSSVSQHGVEWVQPIFLNQQLSQELYKNPGGSDFLFNTQYLFCPDQAATGPPDLPFEPKREKHD